MKPDPNFSLINIDKPAGPTSHTVSNFIKNKLKLSKTSHMGTLDPSVTGVLPITLGRACKLAGYFIKHDKDYVGVLHTHKEQKIEELQKLIDENFTGKIKQTPPNKSAVKRAERERCVYSFKFIEALDIYDEIVNSSNSEILDNGGLVNSKSAGVGVNKEELSKDFLFECSVEGGTYIRKICSDLGDMIGGAHMSELRRTRAGIFDESTLIKLDEFEGLVADKQLEKHLVAAEDAIKEVMKCVEVEKRAVKSLHNGKPLFKRDLKGEIKEIEEGVAFALFCENDFIGIYKRTSGEDIYARAEFVYN